MHNCALCYFSNMDGHVHLSLMVVQLASLTLVKRGIFSTSFCD